MGKLKKEIDDSHRDAAYLAAINAARSIVREERNFLSPHARLGTLSQLEWRRLAEHLVSGWIIERSKQLHADRILDEESFLAEGSTPEPFELGRLASILPALGHMVENNGLTERPIGAWSRDEILRFVWEASDMVARIEVDQKERPTEPSVSDIMYAG
jgi:hypothetical protein